MNLPKIHGGAKDQGGDDSTFPQGPFCAEEQRQCNADDDQQDVDLLPKFALGGTNALGHQLNETLHGGAHQVGFQHQRTAKGAGKEGGYRYQQPDGIEGKADVLQQGVQEEVQHGTAQRDVQDLQKLRFAEGFSLDGNLAKEEGSMKNHGESADFDAQDIGDGGDGGIHRQDTNAGFHGKGHGTIHQNDAQNGISDFLFHYMTSGNGGNFQ